MGLMGDSSNYAAGGFDVYHAACLAYNLPPDSRTMKKLNPEYWGEALSLLSRCEFWAHSLVWMLSEDGKHGRNKPELVSPVKEKGETIAVTRERLKEIYEERNRRAESH